MFDGSVLAIGAHPDDVVMGLGGILARFAKGGHRVTILTLSSGELAGEPDEREQEDRRAAERLGASVVFGYLPDGAILQKDAMNVIADAMREFQPALVFAHDPSDTHQDHVSTARAATAACRMRSDFFYYEGPSTTGFAPGCIVDVSATWHSKLEAMAMHASQIHSRALLEWVHATARYRAWPRYPGAPCEALRVGHARFESFFERPEGETHGREPGGYTISDVR